MEHLELLANCDRKTCGGVYEDVQVLAGESGRCEGKESKNPSHASDSIRIRCPTATADGVAINEQPTGSTNALSVMCGALTDYSLQDGLSELRKFSSKGPVHEQVVVLVYLEQIGIDFSEKVVVRHRILIFLRGDRRAICFFKSKSLVT